MREINNKSAQETLDIIEKGNYTINGQEYSIVRNIEKHPLNTKTYSEQELDQLLEKEVVKEYETKISVTSETTLAAAKRLKGSYSDVAILNFASAKNPGGGFLKGSNAQEESIARSSSMYESIKDQKDFYDYHRAGNSSNYSHRMIYSKGIVVFKNDNGNLIEPYEIDILTSAAVNVGALRVKENIELNMEERIERIIALFASEKREVIVLGAFGCGVFKNDPKMVAKIFNKVLKKEKYKGAFKEVVFAIFERDYKKPIEKIFKNELK